MPDNDTLRLDAAITAFGRVLAMVPRGKRFATIADANLVEGWMHRTAAMLDMLRQYHLDKVEGDRTKSPFVQEIDRLIRPRLEVEDPPT